jgi:beta-glucanase (GH16 family)
VIRSALLAIGIVVAGACVAVQPPPATGPQSSAVSSTPRITSGVPTQLPTAADTPAVGIDSNFGEWDIEDPWREFEGLLVNTVGHSNDDNVQLAPWQPRSSSYEITAEIQVSHPEELDTIVYSSFGIIARDGVGADEQEGRYYAGIGGGAMFISDDNGYGPLGIDAFVAGEYDVDDEFHEYRLVVDGNRLTLIIDGSERDTVTTTDNQFLSPGRVGVWGQLGITVRSFSAREI